MTGDTIGTVHLKGIPESDLSVLSKLEWGQRGAIVELIAELDLTVKYPRKQYHPLTMAATFVEWSGRMAELVEEGKALAAQKAEQEAQAKKEAAEREERERREAVERGCPGRTGTQGPPLNKPPRRRRKLRRLPRGRPGSSRSWRLSRPGSWWVRP